MVLADSDENDVSRSRIGAVKVMTAESLGEVVSVGLGVVLSVGLLVAVALAEGVGVGEVSGADSEGLINANAATAITATAIKAVAIISIFFKFKFSSNDNSQKPLFNTFQTLTCQLYKRFMAYFYVIGCNNWLLKSLLLDGLPGKKEHILSKY
jgi:hypothetical protein